MFVKPGYLSKQMTDIEKERQKTIEENHQKMKAVGLQEMADKLFGSKQNGNGKRTKDGTSKVGHAVDPKYVPPEGEESLSSCGDDDESSRPRMKKVIVAHDESYISILFNSLDRH